MFQRYEDPEPLPIRRVTQPSALARQRVAMLREKENSHGHLSYALVLIFLFQTLLLGCVTLFLGTLVLFSFIGVSFRAQEATQLAVTLTRIAPLMGTPAVSAMLPAPTSTVSVTALPTTSVTPTLELVATPSQAPTPTPMAPTPPPPLPVPENPLPTATAPVVSPAPTPPVNNVPIQPADRAAIQTYGTQIVPSLDQLSGAIERVRELAQTPNFTDQQWVANAKEQIGIIHSAHNNLQTIQPPQPVAALHNELINAVNACSTAADIFDTAIANRNTANLTTAIAYMQSCLATFPQVSSRVRDYVKSATGQSAGMADLRTRLKSPCRCGL